MGASASGIMDYRPQHTLGLQVEAPPYLNAWATAYTAPIAVVDPSLTLVWSNSKADALFRAADQFRVLGGRIACADKGQDQQLKALVAGLDDHPSVWIYRGADRSHTMVRAQTLQPAGHPAAAALTFHKTQDSEDYVWADFGPLFGLTPAEASVIKHSINGERADAIAEALGVSLNTVRTHLRRAYSKLQIKSREQLFSLICPYRLR